MLRFLINNPYFNAIKNINAVLDPDQKRKSIVIIFLMIVNAIFDVFGLMTIVVLITGALESDVLTSDVLDVAEYSEGEVLFYEGLRSLYQWSEAESVMQFLFISSIFIFVIFLIKNALSLYISFVQTRYSYNISLRLNKKMFKHFYDQGYLFIQDVTSGKRVYSVVDIPMRFASSYLNSALQFTTEILVVLIIVLGLFLYEPLAVLLLMIVVVPVFLGIYAYSKNRIRRIGETRNEQVPLNYAKVIEGMKGYVDIKLSNRENNVLDNYSGSQKKLNWTDVLYLGVYHKISQRTNDIVFGLGILVIFGYAFFGDVNKTYVLTMLGLFGLAAYKVLPAINRMMQTLLTIKNSSFVIEELKVLKNQKLVSFEEEERAEFNESIVLENVSFSYPDNAQAVINNINLEISKGKSLGIIGGSGSGKTTLLRLLLRVIFPTKGGFIVDGKVLNSNLSDIGFQKNVGYVEQDVFILNGTLKENIAFGDENIDMSLLGNAIENAMLSDFINDQRDGVDMQLGESGVKLSGGQKQRVGIARALYKQSEILIFDEATSALDPTTEKAIVESINHLSTLGKTIVIVAHRITTLEKCDRIIELKDGKLYKEHKYADLIAELH